MQELEITNGTVTTVLRCCVCGKPGPSITQDGAHYHEACLE